MKQEPGEDKLMCHLARAARNQHLIPHTAHLTRRQSFVWHDIMTLWLSWHFLLFTVTHDTCDVTWSMSSWHQASGGMSSPICQAQNISIKIVQPSFSLLQWHQVKLYFPWVDTKSSAYKKFSEHSSVWQWRNVVKYCSAQYWFYVFYAAFCRVFVKITDI